MKFLSYAGRVASWEWGAVFGRSVNPISTMGGKLCPPITTSLPPRFLYSPSYPIFFLQFEFDLFLCIRSEKPPETS